MRGWLFTSQSRVMKEENVTAINTNTSALKRGHFKHPQSRTKSISIKDYPLHWTSWACKTGAVFFSCSLLHWRSVQTVTDCHLCAHLSWVGVTDTWQQHERKTTAKRVPAWEKRGLVSTARFPVNVWRQRAASDRREDEDEMQVDVPCPWLSHVPLTDRVSLWTVAGEVWWSCPSCRGPPLPAWHGWSGNKVNDPNGLGGNRWFKFFKKCKMKKITYATFIHSLFSHSLIIRSGIQRGPQNVWFEFLPSRIY